MANLTAGHDPKERLGQVFSDGVKADEIIFRGAAVLKDSNGYLVNAANAVSGVCRGIALDYADATGLASGVKTIEVKSGMFEFDIYGSDAVDDGDCEQIVYFLDNHTVRKGSNAGAAPAAGRLKMVTAAGKAVVAVGPLFSVDGDLVAANNLSDVASASTALGNLGGLAIASNLSDVASASTSRTNLGLANNATGRGNLGVLEHVEMEKVSSKASDAEVFRWVADRAGTLTAIRTVLNAALATADATVQAKINGTNVTSGLVTITQAGSAAGDVDSATPSAANTFVAGDVVSLTVAGGSTATGTFNATLSFTY